ncbi:MAG TPA: V-type ATPase subunit [Trueperaceae bacterium]|nr:V-type ATPase subunit [Trueperaceae bacterium]
MSRDLGYINARVRGMKSKLLGPAFTQAALEGTDFRAFLTALSQSPYMREVEEAQARYGGLAVVDSAVARNFYHTARSLLSFSDGKPRELIGLLLLRYDLANVKAIARGKHAGKDADDIRGALFPAGELKPALLEEAAAAADVPSAAQVLAFGKNELGAAFLKAARRYQDDKDLYALELALDKAYFQALQSRAERVGAPADLKRHIQREIDATNLLTALKLRGRGVDRDLFVPGGKEVSATVFDAIMLDGGDGALQALASTSFAAVAQAGQLSDAEAAVRAVLDRSARRLAADPLGIGVVVDFLRRKEAEAARVRLLARGKFYGVPRAALEKELQGA